MGKPQGAMDRTFIGDQITFAKRKSIMPVAAVHKSHFKPAIPWEDYAKLLRRNASLAKENARIRNQLQSLRGDDIRKIKEANELLSKVSLQEYLRSAISTVVEDYAALTTVLTERFDKIITELSKVMANVSEEDILSDVLNKLKIDSATANDMKEGKISTPVKGQGDLDVDTIDDVLTVGETLVHLELVNRPKTELNKDIKSPVQPLELSPIQKPNRTQKHKIPSSNEPFNASKSSAKSGPRSLRRQSSCSSVGSCSGGESGGAFAESRATNFAGGDEFGIRTRRSNFGFHQGNSKSNQKSRRAKVTIIPCKSIHSGVGIVGKTEIDLSDIERCSDIEEARSPTDIYEFSDNCSDFLESPVFHRSPTLFETSSLKSEAIGGTETGAGVLEMVKDNGQMSTKVRETEVKGGKTSPDVLVCQSLLAESKENIFDTTYHKVDDEEDYEAKGAKPKRGHHRLSGTCKQNRGGNRTKDRRRRI